MQECGQAGKQCRACSRGLKGLGKWSVQIAGGTETVSQEVSVGRGVSNTERVGCGVKGLGKRSVLNPWFSRLDRNSRHRRRV